MILHDIDDYWTLPAAPLEVVSVPLFAIKAISDVSPLDDQFGVDQPKSAPDALYEHLFGQSKLIEDDKRSVETLRTFAVLDAAKVANLPELLEASGLKHRCLFIGTAFDDMKDVGPWIVQLEEDNNFTRNLFTRSDAPWHLWDKQPGIYVRSPETLEDLWRHFRKFTRVRDQHGAWLYFRFWEPLIYHTFARRDFRSGVINASFFGNRSLIAVDQFLRCAIHICASQNDEESNRSTAMLLGEDLQFLKQFKLDADNRNIAEEIYSGAGAWGRQRGIPIHECLNKVEICVQRANSIGLLKRSHLTRFVKVCEDMGDDFLKLPHVRKTIQAEHTPARLITELEFDKRDAQGEDV